LTATSTFALAGAYLLFALAFSIAVCYVLEVRWRGGSGEMKSILELAGCAVWVAPLVACRLARPAWMIAAAIPLAAGAGRLFSSKTQTVPTEEPARGPSPAALIAACVIEAGAIAVLLEQPALGALLLGAAAALVAWRLTRAIDLPADERHPGETRLILHCMLAFLLTVVGLSAYARGRGGNIPLPFEGAPGDSLLPPLESTSASGEGDYEGDVLHGVILFPELKPHTVLVPPLPTLPSKMFTRPAQRPLSIPFFGIYWIYRSPDPKPPKTSLVTQGNPSKMWFRSTDSRALMMDAHMNLLRLIDRDCCSAIDVGIVNEDPRPDSIALELLMINTSLAGRPRESLGRVTLARGPNQVLHFPIAASGPLRQFDELSVRYHLAWVRNERSARVAIDRFILVPR